MGAAADRARSPAYLPVLALAGLLAPLTAGACSVADAPDAPPLLTLPSDGGNWTVSIETSPQPPRKGTADVTYRITDGAGAPADGLTLDVLPWMPAHGHGTSVTPLVTAQGDGAYLVSPVYLYMAGHWELRTQIHGGAVDDSVVPAFDVP